MTPNDAQIDSRVADAVVAGYYPEALKAAEQARARAHSGFTMASAVAASLVAGGIVGGFSDEQAWVVLLGAISLIVWLAAALLFVIAVAVPVRQPTQDDATSASTFTESALRLVREERQTIDRRAVRAQVAVGAAMALTVVTLGGVLFSDKSTSLTRGVVVLTSSGAKALASQCGVVRGQIKGAIDIDSLDQTMLEITTSGCARDRVRVRSGLVAAFIEERK